MTSDLLEKTVQVMFDKAERQDGGCWISHVQARPGRGPRTTFQGKEITLMALVLRWKTGRPLRSPTSPSPEYARRTCDEKCCINPAHLKVVRFRRIAPTEVVEAYREGATLQQLADRYGVPLISCHRIIHELAPGLMRGKGAPRRSTPSERDRRILENRQTGMSLGAIGELEGISNQRVSAVCKRWRHAK